MSASIIPAPDREKRDSSPGSPTLGTDAWPLGRRGGRVLQATPWQRARLWVLLLLQRSTVVQVRSSVRLMPQYQPSGKGLLFQRLTAVQVRSSVRLMPQNQPPGRGLLLQRLTAVQVRSSVRLMPQNQPPGRGLLLQRLTAVQVRSSVRLMPQNQPSGRGLLPSPTAWSPDQRHEAMLGDLSRPILGRTEGRGLGIVGSIPRVGVYL